MTLQGRVAVVTGAGRGVGRAVALGLADAGVQLALVARAGEQVGAVAEEATARGVTALAAALDVRDAAAVQRLLPLVEQQVGPIDLLVNGARRVGRQELPSWEDDLEDGQDGVEVDLRGAMVVTRAVLPAMVQRGRGHVVTIATPARAATRPGSRAASAVAERGASALTSSLAGPLSAAGVVVVDVRPGPVGSRTTGAEPVGSGGTEDARDDVVATVQVVLDVARGRYDDRCGDVLQALASRRSTWPAGSGRADP